MSTIRFKALEQLMNRQAVKVDVPDKKNIRVFRRKCFRQDQNEGVPVA